MIMRLDGPSPNWKTSSGLPATLVPIAIGVGVPSGGGKVGVLVGGRVDVLVGKAERVAGGFGVGVVEVASE
ncbi:MAG: hypothetical protein PVG02_03375 [Anaerolineales bacterium]